MQQNKQRRTTTFSEHFRGRDNFRGQVLVPSSIMPQNDLSVHTNIQETALELVKHTDDNATKDPHAPLRTFV